VKNKLVYIVLSLVLVTGVIAGGIISALPAKAASATTSLHIIKYDTDGSTILAETTVTIADLETGTDHPPVQGDGTTHYYTEGPTYDPDNLWDPDEICPGDSLKDKGALKGTALQDICELVGGMADGDQVNVMASDGYNATFDYTNVYNTLADPALNARQGPIVICWWKDEQYSGSGWGDGMLLAFFTTVGRVSDGKLIFGHQDMHDCLPEHDWHYYYDNSIAYPSTHGLYIKYIKEIRIFTGGVQGWTVTLSGARNDVLTNTWFENGIACHTPPDNPLAFTYTDANSDNWSGLPLWYVCGLVDDANIHGPGAFNDGLYYDVKVSAEDGYSYTFPSTDIARNNDYILANKLNGNPLPEDKYPLKLVNPNFTAGGPSVAQIARIDLLNISTTPPTTTPTTTPGTADWPLQLVGAQTYSMTQAVFESGADCHPVSYTDDEENTWSGVPLWLLVGWVDDEVQHGEGAFNDDLIASGYRVKIVAADGYYQMFDIADIARNDDIFVANKLNGAELPETTGEPPDTHPAYPLKITGAATSSGDRVGAIVRIELVGLPSGQPDWDLNGDHVCNIGDVVKVGLKWGLTGTPGWIPEDLNTDGVINIGDIVVLGLHWGQTW
jgi:DMSO/TMAO reductase YedYZ molybdopterin-dependent catalytic subunit